MEVKYTDQKNKIVEEILAVNNKELLNELQYFITKSVSKYKKENENELSFEQWNEQFIDDLNLDDFVPEYGTTLREFRKGIYEAEMSETIPVNVFQQKLRKLYEKA